MKMFLTSQSLKVRTTASLGFLTLFSVKVPKAILGAKEVTRILEFSSSKPIKSLRIEQSIMLDDKKIEGTPLHFCIKLMRLRLNVQNGILTLAL